jgi:hypothetical protein
MAINEEDVIYILTKTDVQDAAESIGIEELTELHYRKAKESFEHFVAGGLFNWADAFIDGLRDAEEELREPDADVSENDKIS